MKTEVFPFFSYSASLFFPCSVSRRFYRPFTSTQQGTCFLEQYLFSVSFYIKISVEVIFLTLQWNET